MRHTIGMKTYWALRRKNQRRKGSKKKLFDGKSVRQAVYRKKSGSGGKGQTG